MCASSSSCVSRSTPDVTTSGAATGGAAVASGLAPAFLEGWRAAPAIREPIESRLAAAAALADSLHASSDVDDELWSQLGDLFSAEEILELLLLVGHYTTTAYVLNALRAG
jgi:alkylhydroperoxidase family enzyme